MCGYRLSSCGLLLGSLLWTVPVLADTAHGISELKLLVEYTGSPGLLRKGTIIPGAETAYGYGSHFERWGEETSFPDNLWSLNIFADALADSPPESESFVSYSTPTGSILELYSDPEFYDQPQTVTISAAAIVSFYAFAYPEGWAKASASYSINAFGSDEDAPSFSLFPPFSFSIEYFPVSDFSYIEELRRTFTLQPGQHYYVNLRDATVSASAYVPVPEPASWALMVIGFGLIGYRLRKRPSAAVVPI